MPARNHNLRIFDADVLVIIGGGAGHAAMGALMSQKKAVIQVKNVTHKKFIEPLCCTNVRIQSTLSEMAESYEKLRSNLNKWLIAKNMITDYKPPQKPAEA